MVVLDMPIALATVLTQRGDAPGLVHVLSAMEACPSYRPWHDKASGKTYLRGDTGKCLQIGRAHV